MKIATWNVERLKHKGKLEQIIQISTEIWADIFVFTETDKQVVLDFPYHEMTASLSEISPDYYKTTEHRVSVFSRYPIVRNHDTFDKYTALCVELATPKGNLLVYGTIMGIFGNRDKSFQADLEKQVEDFQRLAETGLPLCICGDYNLSFGDNYYFTKLGRSTVMECFEKNHIRILTAGTSECIDHISVSSHFMNENPYSIKEWNTDKKLSDHKGIAVTID